jgi:hypothetical protein
MVTQPVVRRQSLRRSSKAPLAGPRSRIPPATLDRAGVLTRESTPKAASPSAGLGDHQTQGKIAILCVEHLAHALRELFTRVRLGQEGEARLVHAAA